MCVSSVAMYHVDISLVVSSSILGIEVAQKTHLATQCTECECSAQFSMMEVLFKHHDCMTRELSEVSQGLLCALVILLWPYRK